jgi:hypothetical protein
MPSLASSSDSIRISLAQASSRLRADLGRPGIADNEAQEIGTGLILDHDDDVAPARATWPETNLPVPLHELERGRHAAAQHDVAEPGQTRQLPDVHRVAACAVLDDVGRALADLDLAESRGRNAVDLHPESRTAQRIVT